MTDTRNLWKILGAILLLSFGILLYMGREIYLAAPPMPTAVQTTTGQTVFTQRDIETGREVWQTTGGHQQGSIWATVPMSPRTGPPTGCTAKPPGCSSSGPRVTTASPSMRSMRASRPR